MLDLTSCTSCSGRFVTHKYELARSFVCGLCDMPARAGKTRAVLDAQRDLLVDAVGVIEGAAMEESAIDDGTVEAAA